MITLDQHIGARLRKKRAIAGLSQEAVAKPVGITFQQVQKYEKGINAMNASRLYQMSKVLNVPIVYFFLDYGGDGTAGLSDGKASDRETLELVKAFNGIRDKIMRQRLSDLVHTISKIGATHA